MLAYLENDLAAVDYEFHICK